MVLINSRVETAAPCLRFQAQVSLIIHPTTILQGFRATIHIGNIRQTAIIEGIEPTSRIKTNDAALVSFKFIRNPEYVTLGSRVLFRDGRTKGIGNITKIEKYGFCNTNGATMSDINENKIQHSPLKMNVT